MTYDVHYKVVKKEAYLHIGRALGKKKNRDIVATTQINK